jgi:hypothetical protein
MPEPRTYAELRRHWLQQILPGADLPLTWQERTPDDLTALRDQLLHTSCDGTEDREAPVHLVLPGALAPALGSPEDLAALIELARTARTVRGPGSQYLEELALQALVEVADVQVLPFLAECFQFSRPHDGSAGHRRVLVLRGIVTIGLLTRQAEALALLDEGLAHTSARVRRAASQAIAEVRGMAAVGLPVTVAAKLEQLAHHDPARDVQVSARLALEATGPSTSYESVPS